MNQEFLRFIYMKILINDRGTVWHPDKPFKARPTHIHGVGHALGSSLSICPHIDRWGQYGDRQSLSVDILIHPFLWVRIPLPEVLCSRIVELNRLSTSF